MAEQISANDVYQPKLLSYVLSRAYAKDLPSTTNYPQCAAKYFRKFLASLTGQKGDDE